MLWGTIGWTILTRNLWNVHLVDPRERTGMEWDERARMQFVFHEKGASGRVPRIIYCYYPPLLSSPSLIREIRTS